MGTAYFAQRHGRETVFGFVSVFLIATIQWWFGLYTDGGE
jgi:hypothetical protein